MREAIETLVEKGALIQAKERIQAELREKIEQYQLYDLLAKIYEREQKIQKAYLCMEAAVFYSEQQGGELSEKHLLEFQERTKIRVPKVAIVILTYNQLEYTKKCIESIRKYNKKESYELIVVDNNSTDGTVEWLQEQKDIKIQLNKENRGFPAGCNQGIRLASKDSDILLLNNDTIVMPNSILNLRLGLYNDNKVGAAGAATNYIFGQQCLQLSCKTIDEYFEYAIKNNVPGEGRCEPVLKLTGFALLIRRKALDYTGYLDEFFFPGNFDDDDYSIRLLRNGYCLLFCKNCFIYHYGSISFGKEPEKYQRVLRENTDKFIKKWKIAPHFCTNPKEQFIAAIKKNREESFRVLHVGCEMGATLMKIRYMFPNAELYGIEKNIRMAEIASVHFNIIEGDFEMVSLDLDENYFDYIILGNLLDQFYDPISALKKAKRLLTRDGIINATLSNAMHTSVLLSILKGSYRNCKKENQLLGCQRIYSKAELYEMFHKASLQIQVVSNMVMYQTEEEKKLIKLLVENGLVESSENLEIYQFYVIAGRGN